MAPTSQFERAARTNDHIGRWRYCGRASRLQCSIANGRISRVAVVGQIQNGRATTQFLQARRTRNTPVATQRVGLAAVADQHTRRTDVCIQDDGATANVIEDH